MKKLILATISLILDILPARWTIKTLCRRDEGFYCLQQQAAVRCGKGLYPKRQPINYHRFFANRITADVIGCGVGALAHSMAQTDARVIGIDFNKKSLV